MHNRTEYNDRSTGMVNEDTEETVTQQLLINSDTPAYDMISSAIFMECSGTTDQKG